MIQGVAPFKDVVYRKVAKPVRLEYSFIDARGRHPLSGLAEASQQIRLSTGLPGNATFFLFNYDAIAVFFLPH
jgi:hypothetical protein